jgi:dTDP-4-amino-4,6-dideoxygalactose transaminase
VCAFSNVGRVPGGARWEYPRLGWNYRPSEYLAALLLTRLPRLEEQTRRRNENAAYLSKGLSEIEGIEPPALAPWATMHGYHLYIFRYDPSAFGGRPRGDFLRALSAEGIACSGGYGSPLSEEGGMKRVRDLYPELVRVEECPNVDRATQDTVWLYQQMLLGDASDMDDILEAVAKIQKAFRR